MVAIPKSGTGCRGLLLLDELAIDHDLDLVGILWPIIGSLNSPYFCTWSATG